MNNNQYNSSSHKQKLKDESLEVKLNNIKNVTVVVVVVVVVVADT